MRFLTNLVAFYASLFSAYIDRDDLPPIVEPDWTDGT